MNANPNPEVIEPQVLPPYRPQSGLSIDRREIFKSPFFWFALGGVSTGLLILFCLKHSKK